jgi:hypothetical protein
MKASRPWTKVEITDSWIEIRVPFKVSDIISKFATARALEAVADDLNHLLKDHYLWKDYTAEVNTAEEEQCIFCGHKYGEYYENDDKNKEHPKCSFCGKGETELMLKKLEAAK